MKKLSPQNRQQPAETSPRTQTRQAQSGGTSTQSGKAADPRAPRQVRRRRAEVVRDRRICPHWKQVEEARAKLAHDLAFLRSPQPYREFGADLRAGVQSGLRQMLDDLKARAAANPSAALAIGAGIAWRFMKDPPIATALIGAGMLSLWRTTPIRR